MSKYFEVRWHGRGGQGTVTGAKSLAEAVQGTGRYVMAFPDYGPERRGAPLRAYNRFSDKPIRIHTPVHNPNVVVIVDPTLIGSIALIEGIRDNTVFIVNTEKDPLEVKKGLNISSHPLFTVPANRISYELFGREIPNSAMLGGFARACPDIITLEALMDEAEIIFSEMLGEDLVELNLKAIERGHEEVGTL